MDLTSIIYSESLHSLLRISIILIFSLILLHFLQRSVSVFFKRVASPPFSSARRKRMQTLQSLIQSLISVTIITLAGLQIASDVGFNIIPFLTGAGIIGIAISFGSQTLVKDVISGFFLLFDNQVNVGDEVRIADTDGTVINILMRTIVLEDKQGNVIYIPNSEVKKITVFREKEVK